MNYRVDLILESEQRSASLISKKMVVRTLCIVIPLSIALMVTSVVTNLINLKSNTAQLEESWKSKDPLAQKAMSVRNDLNAHLDMQNELAGWKAIHSQWAEELIALQAAIPEDIQLVSLTLNQTLAAATPPSRNFSLTLDGKSVGESLSEALAPVKSLATYLETSEFFKSKIKKVELHVPPSHQAAGAGKPERQFRLLCTYQERTFQ
jgi:hypothetical protein